MDSKSDVHTCHDMIKNFCEGEQNWFAPSKVAV